VQNTDDTGTALEITQSAIMLYGGGMNNNWSTVFTQQAKTGPAGKIRPADSQATVIDHKLTNDDPNAILIVTLNGGTLDAGVGPPAP
jgi:hypothetical protein